MYKIRHIIFIALSFLVAVLFIDCKDPGVFEEQNEISNGTTNGKDGISINWLGSFASKDEIENPKYLDAYFNSTDGCSYIYDGTKWELLARGNAEKQEGHNHTYSEEWSINDDFHWHVATCEHGEQITELGAHNYVFNKVIEPAECEKNGVAEYICICGKRTEKTIPPTGHSNSEKWLYDKDYHWHDSMCEHNERGSFEPHIFTCFEKYQEATESNNKIEKRVCGTCGYIDVHEYYGTMLHEHSYDRKTFACSCGKVRELSVQEFLTAIGKSPVIITADSSKPGITPLVEISGVNVYGVSITGEFSEENHFPSSLNIADLRGLDTSNITNMSYMFADCYSLTNLDINNFDTSKVTDMSYMFMSCYNLGTLRVDSFDTSGVTDMSYMFADCRKLFFNFFDCFNTSNVINMDYMFSGCTNLSSFILIFDTSNVTSMKGMFCWCNQLNGLDLSSFDTSNVLNMDEMFRGDYNLGTIIVSENFVVTSVNKSKEMFSECRNLSGAFSYDPLKTDATYANPETGYFTLKE